MSTSEEFILTGYWILCISSRSQIFWRMVHSYSLFEKCNFLTNNCIFLPESSFQWGRRFHETTGITGYNSGGRVERCCFLKEYENHDICFQRRSKWCFIGCMQMQPQVIDGQRKCWTHRRNALRGGVGLSWGGAWVAGWLHGLRVEGERERESSPPKW